MKSGRKIGRDIEIRELKRGTRRGQGGILVGAGLFDQQLTPGGQIQARSSVWSLDEPSRDIGPRFSLGSSLFANRTVHLFHHPSMYTRRLYTILLHSCLHMSAQSGHAPPSIRLSECIDRRDHRTDPRLERWEAFWKIACSEFGLRDRFCPVFLGVEKSDNFNLFQLHSNSKTKLIGNFFSERIDSEF